MLQAYQTTNYNPSLIAKAAAELEIRRRRKAKQASLPTDWRKRVPALFGNYFWNAFSEPHEAVWSWANDISSKSGPRPIVALWSRGRGKSTSAESIVADLGIRKARTYCMYVSGTQDQADKHVQTIARMLEQESVAKYSPDIGQPKMSKNGNRSWNRQVVQTATGFTIEAVGLNKAVRGQKIDWARPDLIVFDDVDEKHDSELTTRKKIEIITDSILPAGAPNVAVMFMQNLIHSDSIASMLSRKPGDDNAADFLLDRLISGPFPAVEGLEYELREDDNGLWRWRITEGQSLWAGFDIPTCENELNRVGPTAYDREYQHEVDADDPNALMAAEDFDRTRVNTHPDLARVAVAVDPPGGATECGIVVGGRAMVNGEWHGYTLEDATAAAGVKPEQWALEVLKAYHRHNADVIFIERNYGGDMVSSTIRQTKWVSDGKTIIDGRRVKIREVNATRGKLIRAEPVATAFQQGRGHHVGQFPRLEKEWRQFVPGESDSPNRLDAEVWLYTGLDLVATERKAASSRQG